MRHRYDTIDVFTKTRFGDNPLAVSPQTQGLSTEWPPPALRWKNCGKFPLSTIKQNWRGFPGQKYRPRCLARKCLLELSHLCGGEKTLPTTLQHEVELGCLLELFDGVDRG